jgi:hypothetical protein
MTTENQNDAGSDGQTKPKKETFKGKMVRWAITLVLCLSVFKFVSGIQAEQKKEFFAASRTQAIASCGADKKCRSSVDKYFDQCIKGNYSSYKTGRYKRKYTLDLEGLKQCLSNNQWP